MIKTDDLIVLLVYTGRPMPFPIYVLPEYEADAREALKAGNADVERGKMAEAEVKE